MNRKKNEFIKRIFLINILTMVLILVVSHFMKDVKGIDFAIIISLTIVFSLVINSINIVFYVKNNK